MKGKILDRIRPLLPFDDDGIVLMGLRGSLAHGTYLQGHIDDIDVMGVVMPPLEYVFGIQKYEQTEKKVEDIDLLVYDFRKYMVLLMNSNPNVLSLLWLKEEQYFIKTEFGQRLIDNRDMFITKDCYKSFGGYARDQLQRMMHFAQTDKKYHGYMGKKRKDLVDKYGFDCKDAAHCIRLLNMGIELLTTGQLNVWRKDNRLYIGIKRGEWKIEEIKKETQRLTELLQEAFIHSKLEDRIDVEQVEKLTFEMMKDYYR